MYIRDLDHYLYMFSKRRSLLVYKFYIPEMILYVLFHPKKKKMLYVLVMYKSIVKNILAH